jgi:hypothetical protein
MSAVPGRGVGVKVGVGLGVSVRVGISGSGVGVSGIAASVAIAWAVPIGGIALGVRVGRGAKLPQARIRDAAISINARV